MYSLAYNESYRVIGNEYTYSDVVGGDGGIEGIM